MGVMYKFDRPLLEGRIIERPNRFLMRIKIKGKEYLAHCPTTGKIGSIKLDGRPVLVSRALNENRKTPYTVEAISYDRPSAPEKHWIGVNQAASNRYIGYFIAMGQMPDMIGRPVSLESEQTYGRSRLDFKADDVYIEVKTPVHVIEKHIPEYIQRDDHTKAWGGNRLIKHVQELSASMANPTHRAIMLICFQYIRDPDVTEHFDGGDQNQVQYVDKDQIIRAMDQANTSGVETWYAELEINKFGVKLAKYGRHTY